NVCRASAGREKQDHVIHQLCVRAEQKQVIPALLPYLPPEGGELTPKTITKMVIFSRHTY
ncbi:hypothetical protein OFM81_30965, partial [Escherichia coli]|nr:hypothetical protein [Escherichia coli]